MLVSFLPLFPVPARLQVRVDGVALVAAVAAPAQPDLPTNRHSVDNAEIDGRVDNSERGGGYLGHNNTKV